MRRAPLLVRSTEETLGRRVRVHAVPACGAGPVVADLDVVARHQPRVETKSSYSSEDRVYARAELEGGGSPSRRSSFGSCASEIEEERAASRQPRHHLDVSIEEARARTKPSHRAAFVDDYRRSAPGAPDASYAPAKTGFPTNRSAALSHHPRSAMSKSTASWCNTNAPNTRPPPGPATL